MEEEMEEEGGGGSFLDMLGDLKPEKEKMSLGGGGAKRGGLNLQESEADDDDDLFLKKDGVGEGGLVLTENVGVCFFW